MTSAAVVTGSFTSRMLRLYQFRHFLWSLIGKEFKIRYAQSFLGFTWMIAEPLMMVLTLSTVFMLIGRHGPEGVPFPIFFYTAVLPWNLFRSSVTDGCKSFIKDQGLLSKISYPREISVIKDLAIFFVEFMVASLAFLVVMLIYRWPLNAHWLFLPLLLLLQLAMSLGLMFLTASLTVYIRDIGILLKTVGSLWFWFTPIAFDFAYTPMTAPLFYLNPMVGIIKSYRAIILHDAPPLWSFLTPAAVATVVLLVVGYAVFRRLERTFVDVL
jgi:ABC-type polysaccharide/polyol phosphate export permease